MMVENEQLRKFSLTETLLQHLLSEFFWICGASFPAFIIR